MASAIKGDTRDRLGLDRRRLDRRGRLPRRADLRRRLPAPVILNVVNNQWAISSFQGIAGGERHDLRRPWPRLRHPVAARGRQRLPRRVRGVAVGGRAGAARPRSDADRVGHLPRRRALDVGRPVQVPAGRRVERTSRSATRSSGSPPPDRPRRLVGRRAGAGCSRTLDERGRSRRRRRPSATARCPAARSRAPRRCSTTSTRHAAAPASEQRRELGSLTMATMTMIAGAALGDGRDARARRRRRRVRRGRRLLRRGLPLHRRAAGQVRHVARASTPRSPRAASSAIAVGHGRVRAAPGASRSSSPTTSIPATTRSSPRPRGCAIAAPATSPRR